MSRFVCLLRLGLVMGSKLSEVTSLSLLSLVMASTVLTVTAIRTYQSFARSEIRCLTTSEVVRNQFVTAFSNYIK